jgi:hypothetical protein
MIGKLTAADAGFAYAQSSAKRGRELRDNIGDAAPRATNPPTWERLRWALAVGWLAVLLESTTEEYIELQQRAGNRRPYIA